MTQTKTIKKILISLFFTTLFTQVSFAETALQKEMIDVTNSVYLVLDNTYAPKDWKKKLLGWTPENERGVIVDTILRDKNLTVKEFHNLLLQSIKSAHDYHLYLSVFTQEKATLPFLVKPAKNRYFIVSTDETSGLPIDEGDELISFNGAPTHSVVTNLLKKHSGNPNHPTEKMQTASYLTKRIAALGHHVPRGRVTFRIKKNGSEKIIPVSTNWDYTPDKIDYSHLNISVPEFNSPLSYMASREANFFESTDTENKNPFSGTYEMISHQAKSLFASGGNHKMGAKKSFLPVMGRKKKDYPNPFFHNYIFSYKRKNIGYIRINTYSLQSDSTYAFSADMFQQLINEFQKKTDMLIIDQVHNPGGSLAYLYALSSMLSPKPLKVPLHRVSVNPVEVSMAYEDIKKLGAIRSEREFLSLEARKQMHGLPLSIGTLKARIKSAKLKIKAWEEGKNITEPVPVILETLPSSKKGVYTKPIVILVDEMDFSGGDFFPVIMQDNKRATIFGTQTAGAGGYVLRTRIGNNRLGVGALFSYTGSIAQRVFSKTPFESKGVTPDVKYEMTPLDYQNHFQGYKKALLKVVDKKLNL